MDSQRFNLTHGGITQKLLQVAVPIIGTQLLLLGYNLVDMFLLGRVGGNAVAAAGTAGMYMWLAVGFMLVGRMGSEIGVAQSKGRRDREAAEAYARNSLFLSVLLGCAYATVCLLIPGRLIGFLNIQEADVAIAGTNYLFIVAFGMPIVFVGNVIAGIFTGAGNSRVPFIVNAFGLGLNVILDPIFIFTLGLGVEGAAIATVIAQWLAYILAIYWLFTKPDRPFQQFSIRQRPDSKRIRQIFRWSLPMCMESMLFTFFLMVIARCVAGFGASAIAVYRIGTQLESMGWLVCQGFASGLTAFVGQNFGAKNWERIWAGIRKALTILLPYGAALTVLFLVAGRQLVSFIVPEPEIIDMGGRFMTILAVCQVAGCLESVAGGSFRGLGRTVPPSLASIVSNGLRLPLAYILSRGPLGVEGVWWAIVFGATLRGVWSFTWFVLYARTKPEWTKMFVDRRVCSKTKSQSDPGESRRKNWEE